MIITERLVLRQLELSDAPFIKVLLNTPGWLRYIGDRNIHSVKDAEQYIRNGPLKSYESNGFGLLLVTEKASSTPLGICGLLKRDSLAYPDLGFAFLPRYMGKGYAYEASVAVLRHGSTSLKISTVAAITIPDNTPSVNLLKKLDFLFKEQIRSDDGAEELYLFVRENEA